MLVYEEAGGVVCIGQAAHSWVSGQLVRKWGNERFSPPEPLAEVCLGAEQHDIGMADWDRRPELNPETGWPLSFLELPQATHIALWTDAPERVLTQSPYAALLVSMHGRALFETKRQTPEVRRYVEEQIRLQDDLLERIGESAERARRNQQLVWTADFLALVGLIPEWAPEVQEGHDHSLRIDVAGPREVTVDPWPFADEHLVIAYPGRRLTEPSTTEQELHARLASAPWVDVTVSWRPA